MLAWFENKLTICEICQLNDVAGVLYAEEGRLLMSETARSSEDLAVIGLDGETIYEEPADPDADETVRRR